MLVFGHLLRPRHRDLELRTATADAYDAIAGYLLLLPRIQEAGTTERARRHRTVHTARRSATPTPYWTRCSSSPPSAPAPEPSPLLSRTPPAQPTPSPVWPSTWTAASRHRTPRQSGRPRGRAIAGHRLDERQPGGAIEIHEIGSVQADMPL
ncbi:hypothetical protein GZL_08986 [Streptomyces sp. 769]|nr:hypothetical protein GZL_08986 [Streptomyces sp. 769]